MFQTQTQCLESLVGIRTGCEPTEKPFYIEDIEGIEMQTLANIAKASDLSGQQFAKNLINSAAREMLGDIELLVNNGYRLKEVVADNCSACTLVPVYATNRGIIIKTVAGSRFGVLRISKLSVLINKTGEFQFVIDDGVEPKTFTGNFTSGVLMPINLDYTTTKSQVKIYFSDATVGLGTVNCVTTGGCGCGVSGNASPIIFSGLSGNLETSSQYGFLPCASITCSTDTLICGLIKQTPNVFGLTLLYKIAEKYYLNSAASIRNNATVSFNEEEKTEGSKNYGGLYWARLQGTAKGRGVKNVVSDYLGSVRSDRCIICEHRSGVSYVTG